MQSINSIWFIFYYRNKKEDSYIVSQPLTLGEILDDNELEFSDGSTLPFSDVDWADDDLLVAQVPARKDKDTSVGQAFR